MAGMSVREIERLVDHVAEQGVTPTRMKKGVLLRMPNGKTAMLHFSGSDHRMAQNVRAELRRAGITWPTDGDPLPTYITSGKVQRGTLEKVSRILLHWDMKAITAAQLIRVAKDHGETLTIASASKALYTLGWTPAGPTKKRKWLRPLEPDPVPEPSTDAPVTPIRPETDTDPAAIKTETGREFIDTVDSWCADVSKLPADMAVGDVLRVLDAFGLSAELRTWKTPQADAGGQS